MPERSLRATPNSSADEKIIDCSVGPEASSPSCGSFNIHLTELTRISLQCVTSGLEPPTPCLIFLWAAIRLLTRLEISLNFVIYILSARRNVGIGAARKHGDLLLPPLQCEGRRASS